MSAYSRFTRRALHAKVAISPDRDALNDMSWQQFEALVGEAFRRRGYTVVETASGADGGIDLVLKKQGETFLVQCKQWKAYKVGVSIVRELYGVMAAKGATGGFVVTSGIFTDDAREFAAGRNIELMDGKALHALIRGVSAPAQATSAASAITTSAPACPICRGAMEKRFAKRVQIQARRFGDALNTRPVRVRGQLEPEAAGLISESRCRVFSFRELRKC